MDAARPLFAEHGFGGVGTESIVRAAGMTRGALYHQFADKTELFAAVYEAIEEELAQRMAGATGESGADDPVSVMHAGAAAWLDACAEPEVQQIVLLDGPAVLGWERWRAIGMRYGLGLVEAVLREAIESGHVAEQPVTALAHLLVGALDEAGLYIARAEDPVRARADVGAGVDRLIAGLTT